MSRRAGTWWLAWGLVAVFVAAAALGGVLDSGSTRREDDESLAESVALIFAFASFAVVGALVASRQPRNTVGWLFLAIGVLAATVFAAEQYAYRALVLDPGSLPLGRTMGWYALWPWFALLGAIGLVAMLFPDGRLPSRRWRPLLWSYVAFVALGCIGAALRPGPLSDSDPRWPDNPLGIGWLDDRLDRLQSAVGWLLLPLLLGIVACVAARVRRSRGIERQQLKWMAVAVLGITTIIVLDAALRVQVGFLFGIAVALVPVSAGIAMLKYRLYEVDVVIRKTLVYVPLTVVLAGTYVGVVVGAQALLRPLTGQSDLAVAVSTLVVAALFLPVRARVQRFVDRRFYRRRYDAQRTLEAFGARLRDEVDLGALSDELRGVVTETMQPAHASLWLRTGARA